MSWELPKRKHDPEGPIVTPEYYQQKPLGEPPSGQIWTRTPRGDWCLIAMPGNADTTEPVTVSVTEPSIIEHTLLPDDTIQGICLRYNTTATILRRYNYFSGNNIRALAVLKIPLNPGTSVQMVPQPQDPHQAILQKFKSRTGEGDTEAAMYLDDSNWDLQKAIALWKGDEDWSNQDVLQCSVQHISASLDSDNEPPLEVTKQSVFRSWLKRVKFPSAVHVPTMGTIMVDPIAVLYPPTTTTATGEH